MDVFYYWKNYAEDLKAGRIGLLKSDRNKLGELKGRFPSNIWAFKTPTGRKGQLQLMAKLVWSDTSKIHLQNIEATSMIFYDPSHSDTIFYDNTGTVEAIESVTTLLHGQFPSAFRANFQGDNGIQMMEGDFLRQFKKLAEKFSGSSKSIVVDHL
jgi:hypothetical protein